MPNVIQGRSMSFVPTGRELSSQEIEERFGNLLESARRAFARDPSYVVDMAEHGSLIAYKQGIWAIRMEATRAEKEARAICELDNQTCPFTCTNEGACGFGHCRFATPEHAQVRTGPPTSSKGLRTRPATRSTSEYRIEDTIAELIKTRGVTAPAKLTGGSRRRA